MLRAQRLRRRTWRLNGVLAVAAVCAGLAAARALQHPPEPFEPRSVELDVEREPVVRGEHLPPFEELMEAIHAFHPPAQEVALEPANGPQSTRLPLAAFRLSGVVGSREDPCITPVSKDPSHDDRAPPFEGRRRTALESRIERTVRTGIPSETETMITTMARDNRTNTSGGVPKMEVLLQMKTEDRE